MPKVTFLSRKRPLTARNGCGWGWPPPIAMARVGERVTGHNNAGFELPCRYGKYQLLERIGSGGMAEVYLAKQPGIAGFEKTVVVKRLHPRYASQLEFVQLFVEEAKLAAQVQHKNIVSVFDLGSLENGEVFMTMEYIAGTDLKNVLRASNQAGRRIPPWLSAHIVAEVLEALSFAHDLTDEHGVRRNIVHCDVTPENVFLSHGGEVKLGDFGVAQDDARTSDPFEGQLKGKIPYMSSEQVKGQRPDQRSDVFSAGIVLWECLTQRRLFSSTSQADTMRRIIYAPRTPPSHFSPDVPPELDALVLGALEPDVNLRIPTARAMQSRLLEILESLRSRSSLTDVRACFKEIFPREEDEEASEASEIIDLKDSAIIDRHALAKERSAPTPLVLHAPLDAQAQPEAARSPMDVWLAMGGDPSRPPPRMPPPRPHRAAQGEAAERFTYGIMNPTNGVDRLGEPAPVAPIPSPPSGVETNDILRRMPPRPRSRPEKASGATLLPGAPVPAQPPPRVQSSASRHPLWIRAPGGAVLGPFGPTEALDTSRTLLDGSPVATVSISADGRRWLGADRMGQLIGEPVVDSMADLPDGEPSGDLGQYSLTSLIGHLARTRATGRLIVLRKSPHGPIRRQLGIQNGRLISVGCSTDPFEVWSQALSSGARAHELKAILHRCIDQGVPVTDIASPDDSQALRPHQLELMQAHLQSLLAVDHGLFSMVAEPVAAPSICAPIPLMRLLPVVVSRARRSHSLRQTLGPYEQVALVRSERFDVEARTLDLSPANQRRLEPFGHGQTLKESLRACGSGRDQKLGLVLAYLLIELGLLTPYYSHQGS